MAGILSRYRQRRRAGQLYTGPAAWCDDYGLVPRPGYYALDPTGKLLLPDVPLVMVDDAGQDPWDPACHYEYASSKDMPQRVGRVVPKAERKPPLGPVGREGGQLVSLEVDAEGHGEVTS